MSIVQSETVRPGLPILIIGAGPVGLAAAAKCVQRGLDFLLLEAGDLPAWSVRQWSHVRLFSPWSECLDPAAAAMLETSGWARPANDAFPTGGQLVEFYLAPLAALDHVASRLLLGARVVGCARRGMGKTTARDRFAAPFRAELADGRAILGRAVLDCSGIWSNPRRLPLSGAGGTGRVVFGVPDLTNMASRARIRGRSVLVIGSGHSAMTAVVQLAESGMLDCGTRLTWIRHGAEPPPQCANGSARRALEIQAHRLAIEADAQMIDGLWVSEVAADKDGVVAIGEDQQGCKRRITAGLAIVSTGFRPDHRLSEELWVAIDHRWEAPLGLAALIDPDLHGCGQTPSADLDVLSHPERDYFILGAKSFGRAPNFALTAAYDHLSLVVAHLAGDPAPKPRAPCSTVVACPS